MLIGWRCPTLTHMYRSLIKRCGNIIDAGILSEKFIIDPLKLSLRRQACSSKRMRVDEDFKLAVTTQAVEKKKARSSAAELRALPDAPHACAGAEWDAADLVTMMSCLKRSFNDQPGVYHVVEDAVRCGDPPEETLFLALHCTRNDLGMCLPPQVKLRRQMFE
jgi:hypothetical protein